MISFAAIWAVVLRHARLFRRDLNLLLVQFYWPFLDIMVMGFLGSWIQQSHVAEYHNSEVVILLGVLLWQVVGRGCNVVGFSLNEELLSNNIVNLFSLPLRTIEWIIGIILFSGIMILVTALFCMFSMFVLYNLPIWYIFSTFLIFFPPLFFSCIWVGFTCLQIIVMLGKRGAELGFVFGWFLLPFSGAYYPIEVLPRWGQILSSYLPMSYVFQGMRAYLMHKQDPTPLLIKGYILSILYATSAIILFVYCFKRSKQNGLARLAD